MINGISLFSNVGIGETYLKDKGINICVSNELIEKRANFYSHLYPDSQMVCGDITDSEIFSRLIDLYDRNDCDFLMATPPCQGMSIAGKMDKNDPRNSLIIYTIEFIKQTLPSNILIENVPQILRFSIKVDDVEVKILEYILNELEPLGYFVNYGVLDAADYGTPQTRKRGIFLISKIKKWDFPEKMEKITVREVIGELPSLESGEKSDIKWHFAKKHADRHVLWMKNTPTGETAFNNEVFYPQKADGTRIKGYNTTYKRIEWDKPAPTITMSNGSISSQNNVHPGRKLEDGTYSDARVLSILEILRLSGLPDDWNIPDDATENFIRQVIGEGFPPKFSAKLIETMPRED